MIGLWGLWSTRSRWAEAQESQQVLNFHVRIATLNRAASVFEWSKRVQAIYGIGEERGRRAGVTF